MYREWKIGGSSVDSLLVTPLSGRSSEDGGAVSLRPSPCSKFLGQTVVANQEKVPVFDAGTSSSHDDPNAEQNDQVLLRTAIRPACSRCDV